MFIKWFDATEAKKFGSELAELISHRTRSDLDINPSPKSNRKDLKRHDATFVLIEKKLNLFRKEHQLNVYTKAQLGSAFKYALIDNGYDREFVDKITTWLLLKCK